jgi:ribonuclease BN (tRNA processing enzyme)
VTLFESSTRDHLEVAATSPPASMEILGCSAGSPQTLGGASGYLLKAADTTVLVDCGPGVVAHLARSGRISELDAVIVTHEHFDHCGDLMALAYHRAFPFPSAPLPLYAPSSLRRTLTGLDDVFGIPTLSELTAPLHTQLPLHEVEIGRSFSVGPLRIDTLAAAHPVPTMSLRFPQLNLVYTADTALTPELVAFSRESVLLAEATYVTAVGRDFDTHGHMSGIEAGRLARESESPLMILTHFSDPDEREETLAHSSTEFNGLLAVSTPGMTLPLAGAWRPSDLEAYRPPA